MFPLFFSSNGIPVYKTIVVIPTPNVYAVLFNHTFSY